MICYRRRNISPKSSCTLCFAPSSARRPLGVIRYTRRAVRPSRRSAEQRYPFFSSPCRIRYMVPGLNRYPCRASFSIIANPYSWVWKRESGGAGESGRRRIPFRHSRVSLLQWRAIGSRPESTDGHPSRAPTLESANIEKRRYHIYRSPHSIGGGTSIMSSFDIVISKRLSFS